MPAAENDQQPSGFFGKLKARLNRGTNWLASELLGLGGEPFDERTVEELETRLLTADVGVDATTWLVDEMRSMNQRNPGAPAVELLRQTATALLRTVEAPLAIAPKHKPFVILAVGVNGTGKTTTVGKLAHRLKARGFSVLLAAADTFRAAAVEQLQEWGERAQVPVVSQDAGADPAAVVHDALVAARARDVDVVLADTAGRLHTAAGLMDELEKIKRV
ncbi:MAG TPA: signal recognition particle receptor subunit alpha, partial [Gammaproteobacteria bacterium]|nr:signal recognition particle receptor subunit alpha [Gammaproteobacteria bacterium]